MSLLEESGACGLKDLPKELLIKIAKCLELATQVNLWETNKHLHQALSGKVQFVKDFESAACSVPLSYRCHAETFALCGIDLLSDAPQDMYDSSSSCVRVVYTDALYLADTVEVKFLGGLDVAGTSDDPLFQVRYIVEAPDEEDPDEEFDEEDHLLFEDVCHRSDVHKLLCSAPFPDRIYEVRQIASTLFLQSTLSEASTEDLNQCAQHCFELMCSRRWFDSKIYIIFARREYDPSYGLDSGCHAMKLDRSISRTHPQQDIWSFNNLDRSGPVKLDFAFFPQGAFRVEAYFSSSSFPIVQGRPNPEYLVGTDLVQEQCRGFVQLGQDSV